MHFTRGVTGALLLGAAACASPRAEGAGGALGVVDAGGDVDGGHRADAALTDATPPDGARDPVFPPRRDTSGGVPPRVPLADGGGTTCSAGTDESCTCAARAAFQVETGVMRTFLWQLTSSPAGEVVAATWSVPACGLFALPCGCGQTLRIHHLAACGVAPTFLTSSSYSVPILSPAAGGTYFTTELGPCQETRPGAPALAYVPWEGGTPITVRSGVVSAVGTDEASVYWVEAGDVGSRVVSLPLGATDADAVTRVLAVTSDAPDASQLASDGVHVYWTSGTTLRRVPVDGGAVESLLALDVPPNSLALTADRVVLGGGNGLVSVPKSGGTPTHHTAGQIRSGGVAAAGTRAYFALVDGRVGVVAFDGSAPSLVAEIASPTALGFEELPQVTVLAARGDSLLLPEFFGGLTIRSIDIPPP